MKNKIIQFFIIAVVMFLLCYFTDSDNLTKAALKALLYTSTSFLIVAVVKWKPFN